MVFRRDTKVDAFQRQMSALRHQNGGDAGEGSEEFDADGIAGQQDRTQGETMSQRESMQYDVVIVGGGPAGLSAGIRLKQLASAAGRELSEERGRERRVREKRPVAAFSAQPRRARAPP